MKELPNFDELLTLYFSDSLSEEERHELEEWKQTSEENQMVFKNAEKVWYSISLLKEMQQYNMPLALSNVHRKIKQPSRGYVKTFIFYWQRIAAVIIIPLLVGGTIFFFKAKNISRNDLVWQTITTPPGVKSQTQLPDGTRVWLNSGTSLNFPSSFSEHTRNVKLLGEAFFDVAKDENHPFIVDLGKVNIEVVGTRFNVVNYEQEEKTEIVLASGKVKLFEKIENKSKVVSEMEPGQQAVFLKSGQTISTMSVDIEKYTSWIDGKLIFKDDPIEDVVNKLNHWFNVQIEIADPTIGSYIYTATFQHETIEQILNLIRRTSPVEYTIIAGNRLKDGSFEKQRIILKKR